MERLADWRSWPLLRPTSTVQTQNENSGLGIYLTVLSVCTSPTSGLSPAWLKPSSKGHGQLSYPAPSNRCSGSIQASEQGPPSLELGRVPGLPHQLKHPVLCVRVYCLTNKGLALLPALIRPSPFVLFPSLPPRRGLRFQLDRWCSPLASSNPSSGPGPSWHSGSRTTAFPSRVSVAKVLSFSVLTDAESQAFSACNV